ncbi:MAG: tyrosine-type recombinase/integrase, partial [Acidobacteria bacterium]|nr:tyrosine-type recombinase/integrase [Acidobacteriota bacterium]
LAKKRVLVVEGRHLDKKHVPKTTFFELCDQYWELWGKHRRMSSLSYMVKAWKAYFGNVSTRDLTQQRMEKFLKHLMEVRGLGPSGRNRHLTMLKALFNRGVQWGLVNHNPCTSIGRLREPGPRTRFLYQEEVHKLVSGASDSFRPILITALHTGMRKGEIINLKWADVDFKNSIITVQISKSGKKRMLPMDDTLCETLRVLPTRFQKGYLFPSPVNEGQPCYDFKRQFSNAVKKAGIDNFRFHDLRHTFASHLVMSGVDMMTVKELLGHATLTMTMRYSHLAPDHRMRAIKTLDFAYQTDTKTDTVDNQGSGKFR